MLVDKQRSWYVDTFNTLVSYDNCPNYFCKFITDIMSSGVNKGKWVAEWAKVFPWWAWDEAEVVMTLVVTVTPTQDRKLSPGPGHWCCLLAAWGRDKENIVGMKTSLWVMSLHIPNTSIACVAFPFLVEIGYSVTKNPRFIYFIFIAVECSLIPCHFMNIWRTNYKEFFLTLIVMKWSELSRI